MCCVEGFAKRLSGSLARETWWVTVCGFKESRKVFSPKTCPAPNPERSVSIRPATYIQHIMTQTSGVPHSGPEIRQQLINKYICNNCPFYVVILESYGVAGIYIGVLGHSDRMFGCLGNLVMCLPPRRWRQAAPRGELAVCLGGSQEQLLKVIRVDIE